MKKGRGRETLIIKYGYDTKTGANTLRLLNSGIQILETGTLTTRRPQEEAQLIKGFRLGKYTLDEAEAMLKKKATRFAGMLDNSTLPDKRDYGKVNSLLTELSLDVLNNGIH